MSNMIEDIEKLNAYELADMADCATPDSNRSPGAMFLTSVRDNFIEALKNGEATEDNLHEIADNAPDVYTHPRWAEFVDLAAYNEEIEGYVSGSSTMTDRAGVALYLIAERLLTALVRETETEEND